MTTNEAYIELARKLKAPTSKRMLAILEEMYTPEESKLLMELFEPVTAKELAARLKVDEKNLTKKLEELVDNGTLTKGKTQYAFHRSLLAFHHDVVGDPAVMPVSQNIKDLWADFFYNEWYELFVQGYIDRQAQSGYPVHRVWPAIGALDLSPRVPREQILPQEDFRLTIKNAQKRIIAPCGCRGLWGKCDHPVMTCFSCFDNIRGEYYLNKPGRVLKEYTLEETLAMVDQNEKIGLVHIGVCFCCTDACEILYSLKKKDRFDLLGNTRYIAIADDEKCTGCQECVDRCQFDAIEMVKKPGSKKLKASIIKEKCKGCGVCIIGCKQRALEYDLIRPPEYILRATPAVPADLRRFSPWGYYDLK